MQLNLYPFTLPFHDAFTISRKSKREQPLLVVKLGEDGLYGLGETADNSYYGVTVPVLIEEIEKLRPLIESTSLDEPGVLWQSLYPHLKHNLFALCALDIAAWDLYAKKQSCKLYELWKLDISHNPLTDYTIGIDSVKEMIRKLREFPWPIYKIKLGTPQDIEIVRALRDQTDAVFRIDANCAWTAEEAILYSRELASLGVEFLEQPLPAEDRQGMARVYRESALPVIADESCIREEDVADCHRYFHGINIKLTKCGGITPALRMIAQAKALGMKVMTGSMNESTVGTSAVAHLLPLLDYVDMDGPLLLAEDVAEGVRFDYGKVLYADRPGTGAILSRDIPAGHAG
jgi:L-alanine-DL-glutamate epimerase-like enolase superfamily enzyme